MKFKSIVKINLALKVTILITTLIALVSVCTTLLMHDLSYKALKDEIRNNLILLASNASVSIDAEKLSLINSTEDEGSTEYLELQKELQKIKNASKGKIRYIYTLNRINKDYVYILDDSAIGDAENHSSVGERFVVSDYTFVENAFKNATAESHPTPDQVYGGVIQTGYAPIINNKGETVGVIAVDMDVTVLKEKEESMRQARTIAFVLAFALALASGLLFSQYLVKPIIALTNAAKSIARGNLETTVDIDRYDEIGQLTASFNSMARDLKSSYNQLRGYSNELEYKVEKRTEELVLAHKGIKDILDNMSQAIFTIDSNLCFGKHYSKYAYDIFGDIEFANNNILDILFASESDASDRKSMESWLNKIFSNELTSWDNINALQPVKEVKLITKGNSGKEVQKHILLEFKPIMEELAYRHDNNDIPSYSRLMVIVQDITERKMLQMEVKQKEKEYKDNLNQIVEAIKADEELFEEFVNEAKHLLENFVPKLIALREDNNSIEIINDLYRIMHIIKGNSKVFKLERIAGEAHNIESIFSEIQQGKKEVSDELLDEVLKDIDKFNLIFNETIELYNKIVRGMTMDKGKVRGVKRLNEDSEYIKVKVEKFDKLEGLINNAESLISLEEHHINQVLDMQKIDELKRLFKESKVQLQSMKKVEISRLFSRFPRMVRDISMELGKKAKLIMTGEKVSIDKNIYDRICGPIVHIVRNSLDHGIEDPSERIGCGKYEEGTISLNVNIDEKFLYIEVCDDGRGLDLEATKANAASKGFISPEEGLSISDSDAVDLIFLPGLSTSETVTGVSGRGVGMDVVKTYIEGYLKGKVFIKTVKSEGVSIILQIPLSCQTGKQDKL